MKLHDNKLFVDSSWALIGSVLGKGLSLAAGILVARFLGKEIYGEYGMIKNTLLQLAVFSTLGLGYTGTRFISKYLNDEPDRIRAIIRVIYVITFVVSTLLAVLSFVFSQSIANYLQVPETSLAFKVTAFIIVFNAITTSQIGILSGFKDFKVIARNNTISGIVVFLTSVVFTYFWGLYGALISLLISMLFNSIINAFSIRKLCLPLTQDYSNNYFKELILFSLPIALQESLYSIVSWTLSVLMIKYTDYGELGLFQAAAQWSSIVLFIPGVLKNVILSYYSSSDDPSVLRKRLVLINFVATFVPFVFIALLSKPISLFYGTSFSSLPVVLIISCLTSVFASIVGVLLYELISTGHTWISFFIRMFRDLSILGIVFIIFRYQFIFKSGSVAVVSVQCLISALFVPIMLLVLGKLSDNNKTISQ